MSHSLSFSLSNVSVERGDALLLHNINWRVRRGENWAVVGASGSGKSTLAAAISPATFAASGEIDYFFETGNADPCSRVASVSVSPPLTASSLPAQADGYYQSRWYIGEEEATLTARRGFFALRRKCA